LKPVLNSAPNFFFQLAHFSSNLSESVERAIFLGVNPERDVGIKNNESDFQTTSLTPPWEREGRKRGTIPLNPNKLLDGTS
jgi:hypothetical protein